MSEAGASNAMDIEARAAAFLERRRYWDWSDEAQAELDAWLAESLAHRVAYWRLEATLTRTERLAALQGAVDATPPPRRILPLMMGIAATLVISVTAAFMGWKMLQPGDRTYATGVGGHETIAFADGTRIELNTDTVLRARMTTDQRTIWLDKGEAFFQVRHNAAHPFVVIAANHRITDLGTKFLIRRDPNRLEVALLEGSVRFGMADRHTHATLLRPGDVATATSSTLFVTRKSTTALTNELSWRHRMLVFSRTTLADAADEFNRYNREKLIVSDPAVARLMIDGTFRTDNLKAFTEVAEEVFKLHIEADGDQIVISR
ncbi:MAG TPA: FecR domain-containing protein [Rhizomicrobium sp.]|nr:FecR domain-containing protein [Rhizomicrobium sp.]